MKIRNFLLAGAACAAVSVPGVAVAQGAGASDANVIVVTANKREENLNDVGLTITAISGEALKERKLTSLSDVASVVPGLAFAPSNTGTPILTLRGVGFNESSLGVYPAVSVYIDQIPLNFPALASHAAFDLERIEALKGPQGTLFGQNSTGGAINYIAAKPTDTLQVGGDISYGRFNTIEGNAFISGPLSDSVRGRVAVTGLNGDDWQYSSTRDDKNGGQSYVAGRLLLDVDVSDNVKLNFNVNGWRDKSQPQAQQLVGIRVQNWSAEREALHDFYRNPSVLWSYGNPRIADWSTLAADPGTVTSSDFGFAGQGDPVAMANWGKTNLDPFANRRMWQAAMRADVELGGGMTLTSQTSYAHYKQNQGVDGDGMAYVTYDLEKNDGYIKTFNQELRLSNDPTSQIRWMLGGNYEKSTTFEDQGLRYFDNTSHDSSLFYINYSGVTNKQKIENWAVFGNLEFDVTEELTLKAAARYTDSTNKNALCSYTSENGNVNKLFNFFPTDDFTQATYGAAFQGDPTLPDYTPNPFTGGEPGVFTPIAPDGCYTLNYDGVPGEVFRGNLSEDNVSWRVGIDYKISPDVLVYTNVSRGYKAGSFPTLAAASFVALEPVTQESVTAFEGGFKASLANRAVQLNAAAFYMDYKDKQIRGRLLDPVFGGLETLVNIPKSRIYGAEADVTINPTQGLTLSGAVTYLNSKIKTSPAAPYNYNVLGQADDFAGDPLPFTPKLSATFNLDYRHELENGGAPFFGVTVSTRSKSDSQPGARRMEYLEGCQLDTSGDPVCFLPDGVTNPFALKGWTTVDARLGYEAPDGAWKVMLWGKNIFNTYYWTNVISSADSAARFAGMPATYGVTFGFNFR
ncbi:MAG: TonB-dependent receptor [Caenibius sp.]